MLIAHTTGANDMTNRYQCIGDDYRGYFVEAKYCGDTTVWIIPGTYHDDPAATPERELARQAYLAQWKTWSDLEREGIV
jgi:hypothetical protein